MKAFADLYTALDETTKTNVKVDAMVNYFSTADAADAAWALFFLSGRKLRQAVPTKRLRLWARELAGVPEWLFDESYDHVGDLAETIALLLPPSSSVSDRPLSEWVLQRLQPLRTMEEEEQRVAVETAWNDLDSQQRFVWNKLITGQFRVGVSQLLVVRALSQAANLSTDVVSHRLMGTWEPTSEFYKSLMAPDAGESDVSRPYPFFLAYPLESPPAELGAPIDWQAEWKWDGIRAQLIRRGDQSFIWTRGEELVTDRYPELKEMVDQLPNGTVVDGEILPWINEQVQPFAELQKRIGRKSITNKLLAEIPVALMAYDLIEEGGTDIRTKPLAARRSRLETLAELYSHPRLVLSPTFKLTTWEELAAERTKSRDRRVEGLMLKRKSSPYRVGRVRGDWWKWKIDPLSIDAVLIYAQPGHGKRSGLFTDFTFGVWDEGKLVPFAKAYSGLTDIEINKVDAFIRSNTIEKFGPVRTVKPELVFELGFEGIQISTRHKSGIAVRFPRMLRWRTDKQAADADTLQQVKSLLASSHS